MKFKLLTMSALLAGAAVYAEEAPVVSGYVHGTASFTDTDQNGDKGDIGFNLQEGAVYLQKKTNLVGLMVDMPISGNSATQKVDIDFYAKGQAYAHNTYDSGIMFQLGQWDGILGAEASDSVDTVFNTGGSVAASMPAVHRGLLLGYTAGAVGIKAFVANPTTTLTNATATSVNQDKIESGMNLSFDLSGIKLNVGGMYGRASGAHHYLITLVASYAAESWNTALEFDYLKDKDVVRFRNGGKYLTALHFNYLMSDVLSLGLRGEHLQHGDSSVSTATIGPKYEVAKDVSLRAEYFIKNQAHTFADGGKGGEQYYTHALVFGAVARF